MIVAKPQRLVGRHRINDHFLEIAVAGTIKTAQKLTEGGKLVFLENATQTALHQILLVVTEQNATRILQERLKSLVFLWRNIRFH